MKTPHEKFLARFNIRAALVDADEQFVRYCSLHRMVFTTLESDLKLTQLEEIELHMRAIQLDSTLESITIEQNLLRAEHEEYEI